MTKRGNDGIVQKGRLTPDSTEAEDSGKEEKWSKRIYTVFYLINIAICVVQNSK